MVLVATSAIVVVAELVSRRPRSSKSYMVSDPILHHRLRVNDQRKVLGADYRTNSLGFRDREYPAEKPPGVIRILMLGDSFIEGAGLALELTVPRLLEGLLDARCGRKFEVVNAGVASYSPILEYLVLKNIGLGLHPDLVILVFDMTDLKDDLVRTTTARLDADGLPLAVPPDLQRERALLTPPIRKPRWLRFLEPLEMRLNRSNLYSDFRRSLAGEWLFGSVKLTPARLEALGLTGNVQYDYGAPTRDVEGPNEREAWARSERYLRGARDLARARGIPFVIVINPHAQQVSALESPRGRALEGVGPGFYTSDRPFRRLENFGRTEAIPVINPLPLLRERSGTDRPLFRPEDTHHLPRGAAVLAEAVLRGLREGKLVPCPESPVSKSGLAGWEGPYPTNGLPFPVRWGLGPETRLDFETSDDAPRTLRLTAAASPQQVMTVLLDGNAVLRHAFEQDYVMTDLSIPLGQKAGRHVLIIRYALWGEGARAVLFRRIEIVRP